MNDDVVLNECFARDGLQNEALFVPTEAKIALLDRFTEMGFRRIEATSYSNPERVPQFADASAVLAGMRKRPRVFYKATCANPRAVERANADFDAGYGANQISLLVSATEAHSQKNLRASRAQQWGRIREMIAVAGQRYDLVGSLSVVFGCPFSGSVDPDAVIRDCEQFAALGVSAISLGDTVGAATPDMVTDLFQDLIGRFPTVRFIAHFHDTRGLGLANCLAAYRAGCRYFDSAFGGTGGHPARIQYGSGYTGNVATEDLVNLFEAMGIPTGVDLGALLDTARFCESVLGRQLHGRVARSGLSPFITVPDLHHDDGTPP
jgi:hydroxymethylglutaryl-CoA lyase